jgi:hypothetical protein
MPDVIVRLSQPNPRESPQAIEAQRKVVQKSIEEAVLEGGSDLESRLAELIRW